MCIQPQENHSLIKLLIDFFILQVESLNYLEIEKRDVVCDHFGQGSHNTNDDQQLGVGRTPSDEK